MELSQLPGLYNYWMVIVLMMTGLYIVLSHDNVVKKVMGLSIFQVAVIMLYITLGKVEGGTAPIVLEGPEPVLYSNPVPHVLMLTAIVVGVATLALALALCVRIFEEFGTLEDDEVRALEEGMDLEEAVDVPEGEGPVPKRAGL